MDIGFREILLILLIVLILFGAKRIPEMMKAMGQGVKEFKKAAKDITTTDEEIASTSAPKAVVKSDSDKPA